MSHGKIVYGPNGKTYYVDGAPVTKEEYDARFPSRVAEMLASGRPPACRTDATFNEGRCNGNQFAARPELGDHYRRIAEQAGVSTTGKTYLSGLAAYPGDPGAWVSGRGDVERVCRERGYDCEGSVNVRGARNEAPPPAVALAGDIVQDEVDRVLASVPEPALVDVEDLREQIVERRAPKWKE